MVTSTVSSQAFDRSVEPVLSILLRDRADELLRFTVDGALQQRIDELAERSTEGELSEAEIAEYQGYVQANKFLAVLRRQARRLKESGSR